MHITRLRLVDYRSYQTVALSPARGLCVLVGENAAGKTNLLESIFLCALGRSHRTRHDGELVRRGQSGALVELSLQKNTGSHTIACRLYPNQRKELKVDGAPLTRSGELLGRLNVVMFSPEDLRLVKQGPGERRRFMDMELSQLQPEYYYTLQRYNMALRQRNALLKAVPFKADPLLETWTEHLSKLGVKLMVNRAAFLQEVAAIAGEVHRELSSGKEELSLSYQPALPLTDLPVLQETLFTQLMDTAQKDSLRGGNTTLGPHRDDFSILVNDTDARVYGSQGQQRTAALSLKLSQLRLLTKTRGEAPILLLDDVLSELDAPRQQMLARSMAGCQTFLTCTQLAGLEASGFCPPADMAVYRVQGGGIKEE